MHKREDRKRKILDLVGELDSTADANEILEELKRMTGTVKEREKWRLESERRLEEDVFTVGNAHQTGMSVHVSVPVHLSIPFQLSKETDVTLDRDSNKWMDVLGIKEIPRIHKLDRSGTSAWTEGESGLVAKSTAHAYIAFMPSPPPPVGFVGRMIYGFFQDSPVFPIEVKEEGIFSEGKLVIGTRCVAGEKFRILPPLPQL